MFVTNPNQLRTLGITQSQKNVSSNPNSLEQDPQDGNVENLNSSLGSEPKEHLNFMPTQSKDQLDIANKIEVSPFLESNLVSPCLI